MHATTFIPARAWRAHALKNCMTTINAVNGLIAHELSEISRQRLERSQQALRRMLSLLSEDLAQATAPAATQHAFVRTEDIVHAVVARVEDIAEAKGIELYVQVGGGGIVGDAAALAEGLCNLVLNAVQATPAGGAVFVATYEKADGGQLWVVQDTGEGIPKGVRAQVGTPHVTTRPGGSGLGTAVAREVFERHDGIVRFESFAGSGTAVSVLLPGADR